MARAKRRLDDLKSERNTEWRFADIASSCKVSVDHRLAIVSCALERTRLGPPMHAPPSGLSEQATVHFDLLFGVMNYDTEVRNADSLGRRFGCRGTRNLFRKLPFFVDFDL